MDVTRVLEIIEEEINGYKIWLAQTEVQIVTTMILNKIDLLNDLTRRIKEELKKEVNKNKT